MNKVYIVKIFDGESSSILGVFASKDKANKYAKIYEQEQLEDFGFIFDECRVDTYEVIE